VVLGRAKANADLQLVAGAYDLHGLVLLHQRQLEARVSHGSPPPPRKRANTPTGTTSLTSGHPAISNSTYASQRMALSSAANEGGASRGTNPSKCAYDGAVTLSADEVGAESGDLKDRKSRASASASAR
jgi:hypothetical protein